MTPEEYIKAYTRGCSNELAYGGYHEWLTPENALAAVELAKQDLMEKVCKWIEYNFSLYEGISGYCVAKELKQSMKDE